MQGDLEPCTKNAAMCTGFPAEDCLNPVKHNPELSKVLTSIFVSGCHRQEQTGPAETILVNLQIRGRKEGNPDSEVVFTFLCFQGLRFIGCYKCFNHCLIYPYGSLYRIVEMAVLFTWLLPILYQ